ncbi:MAG: MFS transporter [Deltaproteobacteria bacterium]|nr:MFS transporter [Deltaproteobacteria bacterium]
MSQHDVGAPTSRRAWYVLTLLLLAYILNFVDRNILSIVAEDIKLEMGLSDTQLGFLLGPAFAACNVLASFPLARWADVGSRKLVIALGLTVWSAMTAASGLARGYGQLAIARFGIGVGEAAGTPPSHSLISDYFPPERRATALSIYGWGIYLGVMFGFMGGGLVRDLFDWRTAFLVAGLPGIPLALLIYLTVHEPKRGEGEGEKASRGESAPTIREVVRTLARKRTFVWMVGAGCFQALVGYSVLFWGPVYLIRVHGMSGTEVGVSFGLVAGLAGVGGATLGGVLSDRLQQRDVRWNLWLPALVSLAAFPFALPFYLSPAIGPALVSFGIFYFLNNMYVGPMWSLAQGLAAPRMRALASATLLATLNLVGQGVGPQVIGFANDGLAGRFGTDAIRYSLSAMACCGLVAAVLFAVAARTLREDLAETENAKA